MTISFLQRIFLIVCFLLLTAGSKAQTLYLDASTFHPDSNIVHTGYPVRWTGIMNWVNNAGANYSLTYSFGDGQGYVVSKVTHSSTNGSDSFRAIHAYAVSGTYTAKVVLKDALGAAVDSLIRPFNVGSGFIVAGKIYYDCIQNCQPDTGELGLGNSWIGLRINQGSRKYITDSTGFYSIPVAFGDTLFGLNSIPYKINTTIGTFCAPSPITSTHRSAHLAIWLVDRMHMSNLRLDAYTCMGGLYWVYVTTHATSAGSIPKILVSYGDGWVSGYSTNTSNNHYLAYRYPARGDYNVFVDLYDQYFGGPYMRFTRPVHVDSCRKIILKPLHDANKNCIPDSGEVLPAIPSLSVRSKYLGPNNAAYYNSGQLEYLHFPGDTAMVDSVLQIFNPTFSDTVHLRKSCPGLAITDSTPDSLDLPYGTRILLSGTTPAGTLCYADTLQFTLTGQLLGYPPGTNFRLISIYGDGHSDSSSFKYSLDTITLYAQHRYDTSGIRNCMFILQSDGGDADTLRYQLTIDNCFPVYVRAFYDRNKNCSQDSGEAFATDYYVATANSSNTYLDQTTGVTKVIQYASSDSVLHITDHLNRSQHGYYFHDITAAAGCPWPIMNVPGALLMLPLVDTPSFTVGYSNFPDPPCSLTYSAWVDVQLAGNYGHSYSIIFYAGNGLYSDTFHTSGTYISWPIPSRSFAPGIYQTAYRILDDTTGKVIGKGSLSSFTIVDTCGGRGQLYSDADGDCIFSAGDTPLAGQSVSIISAGSVTIVLTDSAGRFFTPLALANDSVRVPDTIGGNSTLSCGVGRTQLLATGAQLSFPYTCAGTADLRLLAAHHYFKDSTADTLILYPSGYSCDNGPGILSISLPAGVSYKGGDYPGGVSSGSVVSWAIDTLSKLPPVIRIGLLCTPVPGNPILCLSASLTGTAPDANPGNNDFYLCDSIRGPIPEYYKSLSSDSMYANGALLSGKELIYSLRVRNASISDTIRSILMYDTLDARLDLSTLHILDATFSNTGQILPGNVLQITSNSPTMVMPDEEAAIRFGVMLQPGVTTGIVITNRFSVVLGGIPEGESNTVYAMAARPAAGVEITVPAPGDIIVYPVPVHAGSPFFIALSGTPGTGGRYELLDARGAVCQTGMLIGQRTQVTVPDLVPGLYLVRIVTDAGTFLRKVIVSSSGH